MEKAEDVVESVAHDLEAASEHGTLGSSSSTFDAFRCLRALGLIAISSPDGP